MGVVNEVIKWGRKHGITNPKSQLVKVMEEVGEIAHEESRGNRGEELVDAIGDTLITVILYADTVGIDPIQALRRAYNVVSKRKGKMVDGVFVKEDEPHDKN